MIMISSKKGELQMRMLSRIPMPANTKIPCGLFSFNLVNNIPLYAADVAKATQKDLILVKIIDFVLSSWPM